MKNRFHLVLVTIVSISNYCTSYGQKKNETYVIPIDYRGKIVVVYKRPFGKDSKIVNDTTYYFIPDDGIAIATNNIQTTLDKSCYVTIDSNGKRIRLPIHTKDQLFKSPDSLRYRAELGIIVNWTMGSCKLNDKSNFCYSDFYFGTYNEMYNFYTPEQGQRFTDSLFKKAKWRQ